MSCVSSHTINNAQDLSLMPWYFLPLTKSQIGLWLECLQFFVYKSLIIQIGLVWVSNLNKWVVFVAWHSLTRKQVFVPLEKVFHYKWTQTRMCSEAHCSCQASLSFVFGNHVSHALVDIVNSNQYQNYTSNPEISIYFVLTRNQISPMCWK